MNILKMSILDIFVVYKVTCCVSVTQNSTPEMDRTVINAVNHFIWKVTITQHWWGCRTAFIIHKLIKCLCHSQSVSVSLYGPQLKLLDITTVINVNVCVFCIGFYVHIVCDTLYQLLYICEHILCTYSSLFFCSDWTWVLR